MCIWVKVVKGEVLFFSTHTSEKTRRQIETDTNTDRQTHKDAHSQRNRKSETNSDVISLRKITNNPVHPKDFLVRGHDPGKAKYDVSLARAPYLALSFSIALCFSLCVSLSPSLSSFRARPLCSLSLSPSLSFCHSLPLPLSLRVRARARALSLFYFHSFTLTYRYKNIRIQTHTYSHFYVNQQSRQISCVEMFTQPFMLTSCFRSLLLSRRQFQQSIGAKSKRPVKLDRLYNWPVFNFTTGVCRVSSVIFRLMDLLLHANAECTLGKSNTQHLVVSLLSGGSV